MGDEGMDAAGRVRVSAVVDRALDPAALAGAVGSDRCGAVVSFVGMVRDHDHGRAVTAIEYEAHPTADAVLAQVALEVARSHPEVILAVQHRLGILQVGEAALAVAVAAPHRTAAFLACAALVDTVKQRLPVWKRQVFADGTDEWTGTA